MFRGVSTVFVLASLAGVAAGAAPTPQLAQAGARGDVMDWTVLATGRAVVLTVSMPDGTVERSEFAAGTAPTFSAFDKKGQTRPVGTYTWELRLVPDVPAEVQRKLAAARERGDEAAARRIQRAQGLDRELVETGSFDLTEGGFWTGGAPEPRPAEQATKLGAVTAADQVIPDDLIVQGSTCVGLDCVNGETFSFDTIRLKENNTRITFIDTSGSSNPQHDWQLRANASSGTAGMFAIDYLGTGATNGETPSTTPFKIEAAATSNSVYVDSTGRVGFRTTTPVLDLHVNTANTPSMRLEQNNSGGFSAQTWDIAGNEAGFFVRDVTGGSTLPFRLRPGAPTSSIDISPDGEIGIGTATPDTKVDIEQNVDANVIAMVHNPSAGLSANGALRAAADVAQTTLIAHSSTRTATRYGVALGGKSELLATSDTGLLIGTLEADDIILGTNNANRLQINGSTGAVTVSGSLTVLGAKNFAMVDPADSQRAIYYAALEGPEAGTYIRGTAKTQDGEVVVELPGYFARITESERMTVQLTPVGSWGQLYVAETTPERLVIRTAPGTPDLQFHYLVQGVRKGYLGYEVERANDLPR